MGRRSVLYRNCGNRSQFFLRCRSDGTIESRFDHPNLQQRGWDIVAANLCASLLCETFVPVRQVWIQSGRRMDRGQWASRFAITEYNWHIKIWVETRYSFDPTETA